MSRSTHDFRVILSADDGSALWADILRPDQFPVSIGQELRAWGIETDRDVRSSAVAAVMVKLWQHAFHYGYDARGSMLGPVIPTDIERDMGRTLRVTYLMTDAPGVRLSVVRRVFSAQTRTAGRTHLVPLTDPVALCGRSMRWFGQREYGHQDNAGPWRNVCAQCQRFADR